MTGLILQNGFQAHYSAANRIALDPALTVTHTHNLIMARDNTSRSVSCNLCMHGAWAILFNYLINYLIIKQPWL